MFRLLKGGIHPYSKKESTRKKALAHPVFPPSQIVLPLYTAREDILEPIVRLGEGVKIGQKIAISEEGHALPIFSGISGTVSKIGLEFHPYFGKTPAVVIRNDFKNSKITLHPVEKPYEISAKQMMEELSRLGVRGMTLEEEPVSDKIRRHLGKASTLILNGVECEPYLTADYRLLLDRLDPIMKGAQLLAQVLRSDTMVFVVQGDKIPAVEALEHHPLWDDDYMKVATVPTRYPYGEEKQVIRLVTGQEFHKNMSSAEGNCVVFNVATAYAVADAILHGAPQTHRAVTVSGGAVKRPRNLWLPIGSPLESLFVNGEGMKEDPALILLGGPLTGIAQKELRAPLLVSSGGLLALAKREIPPHLLEDTPPAPMPCIGCGHCLPVCPIHLMPNMVHRHMKKPHQNPQILAKFQPDACIGCGCCNYRCPSRLPLAQSMAEAELIVAEYQAQVAAQQETPAPLPLPPALEEDMVMILVEEENNGKIIPLVPDKTEEPPEEKNAPILEHPFPTEEYLPEFDEDEVIILVEEPVPPTKGGLG